MTTQETPQLKQYDAEQLLTLLLTRLAQGWALMDFRRQSNSQSTTPIHSIASIVGNQRIEYTDWECAGQRYMLTWLYQEP